MLKAAAGGGGRGLRAVTRPEDLPEAFERCRSEATTAFGNSDVFVERLLARPRHIEVQILADAHGHVVHLFDRDCSVQLRNQKVIEIAPAPGLDAGLRGRILGDAVALAEAAEYVNAGTVEFLVSPEAGEHAFIECNPRIQVEHTVTEQVTGVDLVEAQFRIAGGATLAELGLGSQDDVVARGHAVQARLTATGAGVLRSYQEPSGAGIRVDAVGYAGYAPPPQFDPLLAKVIATSAAPDVAAAVDRARRAVASFHLAGLPTNRAQLLAILAHPAVLAGDARTTLLAEAPELVSGNGALDAPLAELGDGDDAMVSAGPTRPALAVGPDQQPVRTPMGGTVIDVRVAIGDLVRPGDGLLVISAMKMEAVVTSPCAGAVVGLLDVRTGDQIDGDVVVAVVAPADVGQHEGAGWKPAETWIPVLDEVAELQGLAATRLAPGSEDPGVVRQRSRGKLTCRERIALLLDDGSFREVGSLAGFTSYDEDGRIAAFTPANHVGGWGTIEGRMSIVCADDFTSRGGHADGAIGAKSFYLDQLSLQMQVPSVRLLDGSSGGGSVTSMVPQQRQAGESTAKESSGAIEHGKPRVSGGGGSFLPGHLGSTEYAEQLATVPVVNVLLGSVVGIGAAKAVLGHFSVMVRDISQLFVAGPPVVSHAMGYDITKEELGGWQVHCRNGSVDNLAETEEEAVAMTKRFLYTSRRACTRPRRWWRRRTRPIAARTSC